MGCWEHFLLYPSPHPGIPFAFPAPFQPSFPCSRGSYSPVEHGVLFQIPNYFGFNTFFPPGNLAVIFAGARSGREAACGLCWHKLWVELRSWQHRDKDWGLFLTPFLAARWDCAPSPLPDSRQSGGFPSFSARYLCRLWIFHRLTSLELRSSAVLLPRSRRKVLGILEL